MAWIRALVIIPRSPTMTICSSPNFFRTTSTMAVKAPGSPVLPAKTRTATGRPAGSVSSPYSICSLPFLAIAGVAARREWAVSSLHPGRGQVEQCHPVRVVVVLQVPAGQFRLDGLLPGQQPVHRGVHLVGGRVGQVQIDAECAVRPPVQ